MFEIEVEKRSARAAAGFLRAPVALGGRLRAFDDPATSTEVARAATAWPRITGLARMSIVATHGAQAGILERNGAHPNARTMTGRPLGGCRCPKTATNIRTTALAHRPEHHAGGRLIASPAAGIGDAFTAGGQTYTTERSARLGRLAGVIRCAYTNQRGLPGQQRRRTSIILLTDGTAPRDDGTAMARRRRRQAGGRRRRPAHPVSS